MGAPRNPEGTSGPEASLLSLFEGIVQTHPDRIAASFGADSLTYGELDRKANALAHWLRGQGIREEGRVGVCMRPSLGVVVALLAIQKLDATYVPLDPDYPKARIATIVEAAALELTLTQEEILAKVGDVLAHSHPYSLQKPLGKEAEPPATARDIQRTACIFYTSGSTGQPKGIALSYGNLAYYVGSAVNQFGFSPSDTVLSIARYSFSISLFDLLGSLASGAALRLLPRDIVMDFGSLAAEMRQATIAHLGPSLLKGLVRHIKEKHGSFEAFSGLRHVSSGGDFVPADLLEEAKAIFGQAELFVIYGCTEIACMGCFYPVPREAPVLKSYLGRPFAGTACVLVGEDGAKVQDGEVGEICFQGPGLMNGYLGQPDLTSKAYVDIGGRAFYRTGDLGRVDATGHVEFLGRRDFQIKLRGQRIELVEIESCLRRAPGIRDAVVSATRAGSADSRLIAYVTLENPSSFALEPVRTFLRERLPEFMQPSGWVVLERMPLNVNLKISRRDLPLPTPANMIDTESHAEPRTELERALVQIWQEALGLPRVGIHDNFFNLGGDSMMAMNLCMLAAEHGFSLSPTQLVQAPTIVQLVEAGIHQGEGGGEETLAEPADAALACIPPFILRFLYERGSQTPHHWNISRLLAAKRRLRPDLVERAFLHLGAHHDALRLQFEHHGARWQTRVREKAEETLSFRALDLSDLRPEQQAARIAEVAKGCQKAVNLTQGPLACMVLFDLGEDRPQDLFFVVHHFSMDVISWKNFWLEFDSVYRKLEAGGETPHATPAVSFKAWTHLLQEHAKAPSVEAEVRAWIHQDWSQVSALSKDLGHGRELNTNDSADYVSTLLTEEETQALFRFAGAGITVESILVSAVAVALSAWQGKDTVHFDRLVHGRNVAPPGFDLSRTLGCMISYAPMLLTLDARQPAGVILQEVAAQMDRQGDSGTSVDLYRYLGADPGLAKELDGLPRPEVLINYRGRVDDVIERSQLFRKTSDIKGLDHDPGGLRLYPIAISMDLVQERLETRFVFSRNLHRRERVEALGAGFLHFLRAILAR